MKGPEIDEAYDVVVIGAGIAGLTAAGLLSRVGLSVCVLEMDARPGGYLAGFRRKDFRFDSAIHWLNQLGPNGLVTRVFDLIGPDHPIAAPLHRIKRYKGIEYDYLLTADPDVLKDQWIRDFPSERKGIERFFGDAKKMGKAFSRMGTFFRTEASMGVMEHAIHMLKKLRFAMAFIPHLRYNGSSGVVKGLRTYFSDERLIRVFASEMDILSCLVPIGWAYYGDYQLPPVGGSQVFPEWLCHVAESHGNQVKYRCVVEEIIVNEGAATAVRFTHKGADHHVKSAHIIAACDVEALYEKMLPLGSVPESLRAKLHDAELYPSSVTVSLALDRSAEDLGFDKEMIYLVDESVPREQQCGGDPELSGISILAPSLRDPSMAPSGMGTLTLYIPAEFSAQDEWKCVRDADGKIVRGEAYEELKRHYADVLVRRVEKGMAPGLSQHIVYCDVATPITHWRYTGNRNGSMMGARPGELNFRAGIAHYRTPIKGLVLGGHWAELGGGVPIAVRAATNSALLVLQDMKHKAAGPLARYMDGKLDVQATWDLGAFQPYAADWERKPTPAERKRSAAAPTIS